MSRRQYIRYAGAGVGLAAATGLGYYLSKAMPSPTSTQTETSLTPRGTSATETVASSSNLYAPTVKLETDPRYIAALEGQPVDIHAQVFDADKDNLAYSLMVNGETVSKGTASSRSDLDGYPELLYTTKPAESNVGKNTTVLVVSDGPHTVHDGREFYVDEDIAPAEKKLDVKIKGIGYIVGISNWLDPIVPVSRMEEDLNVIRNELGCNAIRIEGDYKDQIIRCGEIAINHEFDYIFLNPRYIDASLEEWIAGIRSLAPEAERLRANSDAIILQPATEFAVDSRAVFKRQTYAERAPNLGTDMGKNPKWNDQLMDCLRELVATSREYFDGKIAYNEAWWEGVNWKELDVDIIGSNQWEDLNRTESVEQSLRRIKTLAQNLGRIFIASEFGCTSSGKWELGGYGWSQTGTYDEYGQATGIAQYLPIFNAAKPDGCSLVYFYEPTHQWRSKEQTFSITKPELPTTDHVLLRKRAFWEYKSWHIE